MAKSFGLFFIGLLLIAFSGLGIYKLTVIEKTILSVEGIAELALYLLFLSLSLKITKKAILVYRESLKY